MNFDSIFNMGSLSALSAFSSLFDANEKSDAITKTANAEAKAKMAEGQLAAAERAKTTRYAVAKTTTSFLSSGLTLEGTPGDVIDETYQTGITDVEQINKNTKTSVKNILETGRSNAKKVISAGRTAAIESLGKAAVMKGDDPGAGLSGLFGGGFTDTLAGGLNSSGYGVQAYDMLDAQDSSISYRQVGKIR